MGSTHVMTKLVAFVIVSAIGSSLIFLDAAQIAFAQNITEGENMTSTNQTGGNITSAGTKMFKIGK